MSPADKPPAQIRGAFFANIVNWVQDAYGKETYQRILDRLDEEDRRLLQKKILTSGWYPVEFTERFANACRAEVLASFGESESTFDRRNLREAGGRVMQSLYKFVLSWLEPRTVITKIPALFGRIYDQGQAEVARNDPGLCEVIFRGPKEMTDSIRRFGPGSVEYVLELSGAKPRSIELYRATLVGDLFSAEVIGAYSYP
jgi:hypothetical protein